MYGLYSRAACNQERLMMARVRYIFFSDSPFTGLFKSGKKVIGFMRMSWSAPNFLDLSTQPELTPGVSIKFLRSGTSSANFVTTNSMDSLPDKTNFFSTPLSNHIPAENSTTNQNQRFCSTGKKY